MNAAHEGCLRHGLFSALVSGGPTSAKAFGNLCTTILCGSSRSATSSRRLLVTSLRQKSLRCRRLCFFSSIHALACSLSPSRSRSGQAGAAGAAAAHTSSIPAVSSVFSAIPLGGSGAAEDVQEHKEQPPPFQQSQQSQQQQQLTRPVLIENAGGSGATATVVAGGAGSSKDIVIRIIMDR